MMFRTLSALILAYSLVSPAAAQVATTVPASFDPFLKELWPDAQAKGITRETFDRAFAGLTPDQRVLAITKRQPEYNKPLGAYVASFVSKANIGNGVRKEAQWRGIFDSVDKKFGVDRWIILSIWGVETSYGAYKDKWDVFRSLATLAQARYRHPYFRNELIVALRILQEKHIARANMVSSWAGAMGQTQFMPSNFFEYAIDFSGDGKPDIWANIADIMGSTANYLVKEGWKPGLTWGFEVTLPKGFDFRRSRATYAEWTQLGVKRADGRPYPESGTGILFFPAGAAGPAFIATENYQVLKLYNNSDAYVIAVGHLADRMRGYGPIRAAWPVNEYPLPREQRMALQQKLADLGYKVKDRQGRIDFDQRDYIRAEQVKLGMLPDGYPTAELLQRLGIKVP